jgi:hypothetical protein
VLHPDRDPLAGLVFMSGGLLATIDDRLGGLLGDDLDGVREPRAARRRRSGPHRRDPPDEYG